MSIKDLADEMGDGRQRVKLEQERREADRMLREARYKKLAALDEETITPLLKESIEHLCLRLPSFDRERYPFVCEEERDFGRRIYENIVTMSFLDPSVDPEAPPRKVVDHVVAFATFQCDPKPLYAFYAVGKERLFTSPSNIERVQYRVVDSTPLRDITSENVEGLLEQALRKLLPRYFASTSGRRAR